VGGGGGVGEPGRPRQSLALPWDLDITAVAAPENLGGFGEPWPRRGTWPEAAKQGGGGTWAASVCAADHRRPKHAPKEPNESRQLPS
jgi:hypothetical protein